jgi:hypothetical protein
MLDHPEVMPMLSVAIALALYVPATVQLWDELELDIHLVFA